MIDKRELVTLMTLGAAPELLALGYLRNQQLVASPEAAQGFAAGLGVGLTAVAGALLLGGDTAVPGGEWAPAASIGLAAAGVSANCPGSVQGGVAAAGLTSRPACFDSAKYSAATRSIDWQSW
jgi:hypothetical protein